MHLKKGLLWQCSGMYVSYLFLWSFLQANKAGPSTPEEYVEELKQLNFGEQITEQQHQVVDKLRVSLSTNGLG